ncbi:hypothetical protein C1646_763186 [Rhizophagus diaphanus]|nr:hypothetical protein C1646_763186 [Rhizophagus diaphanus] [Rhizophagus sp. MUCL 43196]
MYFSYTIPYIKYSSLETSKFSIKISENFPIKVVLWDEFFDEVNSHKFDQETEYKEPPLFISDTNEESIQNSFNNNICTVLNRVIKDIEFLMQNVDDTENKMKYSVLSTYNDHWFIKRKYDILFISEAVKYNSIHPSVLKSYTYLIELAKNDTYSPDPKIIKQSDNSLYSFQKPRCYNHNDDDYDPSLSYNSSKKSKQLFFKQLCQSSKRSSSEQLHSNTSKKQKQRKQNMKAQKFNYRDFKYNGILSAEDNNKKVLKCEFHGKTIALKSTDLTKKSKCLDEFMNEVKIYKVLAKLQGIYIPELLFYGDLANRMSFVMGMTIVVHEYNILHNDIRKENILIDEKGYVYLIDFGFSIQTYDENMFCEEEA